MNDEPRKIGLVWPLIIVTSLAILAVTAFVLMGRDVSQRADRVWIVVLILTGAIAIGIVLISSSFPIRQWRRGEEKPETMREIRDGTRTVEKWYGLPPGRQLAVPQYSQDPYGFPAAQREFLRAAWASGADTQYEQASRPVPVRGEVLSADDYEDDAELAVWAEGADGQNAVPPPPGWNGDIVM